MHPPRNGFRNGFSGVSRLWRGFAGVGVVALLASLAAGGPVLGSTHVERVDALDFGLGNVIRSRPYDLWSDGETMWVVDPLDLTLHAFRIDVGADGAAGPAHGDRVASEDFTTLSAARNQYPEGIWSDGETMWVTDWVFGKVFAYDMDTKQRVAGKDIEKGTLSAAGNDAPRDIWSDGDTVWVSDFDDDKLYAYDMATQERVPARDLAVDTPQRVHNCGVSDDSLSGGSVWSDGATMWVDVGSDRVYAYWLHDGRCDAYRDLTGAIPPTYRGGLWADDTYMWYLASTPGSPNSYRVEAIRLPPSASEKFAERMAPKWDMEVSAGAVSLEMSWDKDSAGHDDAVGYFVYLGYPADYGELMSRTAELEKADTAVSGDTVSYTLANGGIDEEGNVLNVLWPDTDYLVQVVAYYDPLDRAQRLLPLPSIPGSTSGVRYDGSEMVQASTAAAEPDAAIANLRCEQTDGTALASCHNNRVNAMHLLWDPPPSPPSPVDHYEITYHDADGEPEFTVPKHQAQATVLADMPTYNPTTMTWVWPSETTFRWAIRAILENRAPGPTTNITFTITPPGGL